MPELEAGLAHRIGIADGQTLSVPVDLWNQVSRSATVIDDAVISEPPALSPDARYSEFRNFLSTAEGQNRWTAYGRGFVFQRDYMDELRGTVDRALGAGKVSDEPLVLHGQTGTGKTIALEALAHDVRRAGKYPVLFVERRLQRPSWSDIDRFCQWVESEGAAACLLVWDGMLGFEEYSEFLRILSGRGRKVVLIGSCYRIQGARTRHNNFVEAPAQLSEAEVLRFADFLGGFHAELRGLVTETDLARDNSFLVALYRLLPPSRTAIRTGIAREMGHAEDEIAKKARSVKPAVEAVTALGYALVQSGIVSEDELLSTSETKEVDGEEVSEIQDLTGLVMVPGRFGLRVPLELLLRALGRPLHSRFLDLFSDVDIFRWIEDGVGNIDIGPRNQTRSANNRTVADGGTTGRDELCRAYVGRSKQ